MLLLLRNVDIILQTSHSIARPASYYCLSIEKKENIGILVSKYSLYVNITEITHYLIVC